MSIVVHKFDTVLEIAVWYIYIGAQCSFNDHHLDVLEQLQKKKNAKLHFNGGAPRQTHIEAISGDSLFLLHILHIAQHTYAHQFQNFVIFIFFSYCRYFESLLGILLLFL